MDVDALIGIFIVLWLAGLTLAFALALKAKRFKLAFLVGTPVIMITAIVLLFRV